ncbi:hypothetical protein [Arcanobacterium pinnipediorum]|uniref:Uncharacterized protein n=1 Tax=Arcanobacterium pinnipediorum TaxID=1503041 RepID=A0ABY5AJ44_9ACTO|nr:hypothetical protein [Arcanobacterium pinnipediorum]USR79872.1 hypothetical protein NG665_02495 [Arcanobacterium pinnipediorum]
MNSFERDRKTIRGGDTIEVMRRRKAEITVLEAKLRREKNGFRASIIAYQLNQRRMEYRLLDELI